METSLYAHLVGHNKDLSQNLKISCFCKEKDYNSTTSKFILSKALF